MATTNTKNSVQTKTDADSQNRPLCSVVHDFGFWPVDDPDEMECVRIGNPASLVVSNFFDEDWMMGRR